MKTLALTAALVCSLPLPAWGQQFDNPVTVPVSYYCTGNVQGTNGSFSVGSTQVPGQPADNTFPISQGSGSFNGSDTTASSPLKTAYVIPGKEYDLTVTSQQMNTGGEGSAPFAALPPRPHFSLKRSTDTCPSRRLRRR